MLIASPSCDFSGTDPVLCCMFGHHLLQQDSRLDTKSVQRAQTTQAVSGSLHHLLSQGQLILFHLLREMTGGSL